jgi:hypothetical protein
VSQRPDRANFLIATECLGESTRSWIIIQLEWQHAAWTRASSFERPQ